MHVAMIIDILGGIGLFLLGMMLMTDGLKALAGGALRDILTRFTGGTFSALLSGTGITAIIQSSSATTVTTIGFVSAGLLTFEQAIGVVYGANLGTTSTSWLVSLLGLKIKVGSLALPLIGIGAFMRLLGKNKTMHQGLALAGFGLIFVGISTLQNGMETFATFFDPSTFDPSTTSNSLLLLFIGIIMTVIVQSSSVAIATTLTAIHSNAVTFDQGAVLVIGQSIGTTITAWLAAIGATVPAKRTAYSHVFFNIITGFFIYLILPVFIVLVDFITSPFAGMNNAVKLAVFHTTFKFCSVFIMLPFTRPFANVICRIIPEKEHKLTANLDESVQEVPAVAIESARRTTIDILIITIDIIRDFIKSKTFPKKSYSRLFMNIDALARVRTFLSNIRSERGSHEERERHISLLHAVDHLDQLFLACREFKHLKKTQHDTGMNTLALQLADTIDNFTKKLEQIKNKESLEKIQQTSRSMKTFRKKHREIIMENTASGVIDPDTALKQIEMVRWLDRISYRIWRAIVYLDFYSEIISDDKKALSN